MSFFVYHAIYREKYIREVAALANVQDDQPYEIQKKQYKEMINEIKPKPKVWRNVLLAFIVGGIISLIGQGFITLFKLQGLNTLEAGAATSATLIFIAALLTGLGIYDNIVKYAGAGGIVPITGFANAMVAPAMEFRTEGFVMGVGARLFSVAGPVLVYGIVTAWIIGLIVFLVK